MRRVQPEASHAETAAKFPFSYAQRLSPDSVPSLHNQNLTSRQLPNARALNLSRRQRLTVTMIDQLETRR